MNQTIFLLFSAALVIALLVGGWSWWQDYREAYKEAVRGFWTDYNRRCCVCAPGVVGAGGQNWSWVVEK